MWTALLTSRRPPDPSHPLGYGLERYYSPLLAAIGMFVIGGALSVSEGTSRSPRQPGAHRRPRWPRSATRAVVVVGSRGLGRVKDGLLGHGLLQRSRRPVPVVRALA